MIDLNKVKDYKVLLVGDGITDEYRYVTPIGKSIKDDTLSTRYENRRETFHGGVWAAAQHVKGFCSHVDVMVGDKIMLNRRYVDETYMRKLFTVHQTIESSSSLYIEIGAYDLVIVTDFGHGCLTPNLIKRLTAEAKYIAVNAQTNSTNFGFNLITKYPRADFVVINELEARLAAHDRDSSIDDVILKLGFKKIIVTMGNLGAVGYDGEFVKENALTDKVVDTMGAGDAFLCVAAPFAKAGFPMKDLVRIGNAAGAVKVGVVGHRTSVNRESLEKYL